MPIIISLQDPFSHPVGCLPSIECGHTSRACPHSREDITGHYFSSHRHRACNILAISSSSTIMPEREAIHPWIPISHPYTRIPRLFDCYQFQYTYTSPYIPYILCIVTICPYLSKYVRIHIPIVAPELLNSLLHYCGFHIQSPFPFPSFSQHLADVLIQRTVDYVCTRSAIEEQGHPCFIPSIHHTYVGLKRLVLVPRIGIRSSICLTRFSTVYPPTEWMGQ